MKTVVDTCHRDIHCMQISNPLKYKVSTMLITQHKFPGDRKHTYFFVWPYSENNNN
jgi:hypothetical protein